MFERQEGLFIVSCDNDDCNFGVETCGGSLKEAIELWNMRPTTLPAASEREAIARAEREACARELETSYPDHAWLNAACAAIRGRDASALPSSSGTEALETELAELREFRQNQRIHWPMEIERRNRELEAAEARAEALDAELAEVRRIAANEIQRISQE